MTEQMLDACNRRASTKQASGKRLSQIVRANICNTSSPECGSQCPIEDSDGLEALGYPHALVLIAVTCRIGPDCKQLVSIQPLTSDSIYAAIGLHCELVPGKYHL